MSAWILVVGFGVSLISFARADQTAQPRAWHARGASSERSQGQTLQVQASSVAERTARSSLSWRAPGVKAASEPAPPAEPVAGPPAESAPAAAIDREEPEIQRVANQQPTPMAPVRARRVPVPTTRSKIRDAVLQVSTDRIEESSDKQADGLNDGALSLDTSEPSTPSESKTTKQREPSRLTGSSDPFPDEKVPQPLGADEPSTSEPPQASEQQLPPAAAPREGLTDPEDALYRQEPSMEEPDSTLPDVEVPLTPNTDRSCADEKRECETAINDLRGRDIRKIIVGIQIEGEGGKPAIEGRDYPCECALGLRTTFPGRHWAPVTFTWKASSQCHKPLYFEDVQLERYGHSWNPVLQPFISAGHFFVSVPLLPYKMGLTPPNECMYTLGYYRPGDCAPYMIEPIPLSLRAGAYQALGVTGFVFWFWPPVTGPAAILRPQ